MSDADDTAPPSPRDLPEDQRFVDRRRGEQRRVARALWQGAVALLLALLAVIVTVFIAWRVVRLENALERDRSADRLAGKDLELIRSSIAKLEREGEATHATLEPLEPLPSRLERTEERLASIEGRIEAPQRVVARVEAAHLVELAQHRLTLERDVAGAAQLFAAANERLSSINDPTTLSIRSQLERDLARLRAVPEPDVGAVGARLAAVGTAVRDLPMLGMIKDQYVPPGDEPTPGPGLARAWQQLRILGDLVTVRRVSDAAVQLVSMEEIGVRRHHLETLLFAARLAALRGDDADYAATLGDARNWLGRYFDPHDARVQAANTELTALASSRVSPDIPDVSGSLKLLRNARK